MNSTDHRIAALIKQIVVWLVAGDFTAVVERSGGIRLPADLLSRAIADHRQKLVMPPNELFENLDVIVVSNAAYPTYSVRFDLWTEAEGRSDLILKCTVIARKGESLIVEIDNLHVL